MYICIFNAWNKILYSVFFSLFLVIFYFIQNDSTAYFIDPVFCEGTDFFLSNFSKERIWAREYSPWKFFIYSLKGI